MRTFLLIFLLAATGIIGSFRPVRVSAQTPESAQPAPESAQPAPVSAQTPESAIRRLMTDQTAAWNRGDIDDFMKGYWNNDSLVFIGKSGPSYGYAAALARYKSNYDSPDKMGQLTFSEIKITRLAPDYCFVIGKWALKRKAGDVGGRTRCCSERSVDGG
ncbi:YybH family protein [Puia sp. P3]|uniref:YybH family protein n=1 Tax=Puia sp. P3 TaxID=3423952 RepID=UPI003D6647DB